MGINMLKIIKWKRVFLIGAFLIYGVLCAACSKKEQFLEDTYIEGKDFQYMYEDRENFFIMQAKGEHGYYFLIRNYLYYIDNETKKTIPLCNRTDCIHDKEQNQDKKKECHAYYENHRGATQQIQYYDGNLYTILTGETIGTNYLYKIAPDGSSRTLIKTWENTTIMQWCLHRGYVYFITQAYSISSEGEGEVIGSSALLRQSVEDSSKKSEIVYELPQNLYNANLHWPKAYGNHIYFSLLAYTQESDKITDENWFENSFCRVVQYDIRTKEVTYINIDEASYVSKISFYKDKLLFAGEYPKEKNVEKESGKQWYIADLDGSNQEKFIEADSKYSAYNWDGKYLYEDNYWRVFDKENEEQRYKIYDENMHLVDTARLPIDGKAELVLGDSNYQWILFGDEERMEITYVDKSKIGTFQGEMLPTVSCYKADLPAIE